MNHEKHGGWVQGHVRVETRFFSADKIQTVLEGMLKHIKKNPDEEIESVCFGQSDDSAGCRFSASIYGEHNKCLYNIDVFEED